MLLYPHSKKIGAYNPGCAYETGTIKVGVVFAHCFNSTLPGSEMEYRFSSVIRGHHISKTFWTPAIDEILTVVVQDGNVHDRFAVALSVPGVGTLSRTCTRSLRHDRSSSFTRFLELMRMRLIKRPKGGKKMGA